VAATHRPNGRPSYVQSLAIGMESVWKQSFFSDGLELFDREDKQNFAWAGLRNAYSII